MACNSKQAALENLKTRGLLSDKRVVPMEKLEEFELFNKQMTDFARKHYNLSIAGDFFKLEYQAPNAARPFPVYRAVSVDEHFEKLDGIREVEARLQQMRPQDDYFSREFSAMPTASNNAYTPTNYNDYLQHKQSLLVKVTKRLDNRIADRKFDKSRDIRGEVNQLQKIKANLESQIYELSNDPNIFEKTVSVFNDDLALVDTLLKGEVPSIENIQLAEDIITYFDIISNYSSGNNYNNFVDVGDLSKIEPDVMKTLNKMRYDILPQQTKINEAKNQYLLKAIDESDTLKSLFPNAQLEEIRESLLANKSDISLVSMLFGTVDKEFNGQDSLLGQLIRLELERSRSKNKTFAADMIQKINNLQPRVKAKLLSMGYGVTYDFLNKATLGVTSEVNYDVFYQKTPEGNKTGRLLHAFSAKWFKDNSSFFRRNNQDLADAWQSKDYAKVNIHLVEKYQWLNSNTDFVDITRIPEVLSDPAFRIFEGYFNTPEAQAYKADLISKVGQYNYDKIVEQQKEYLEDYLTLLSQEQQAVMAIHGVDKMEDLPDEGKHRYNIIVKRNDPFEFIQSHKSGQEGRVDYTIGNTGNQYQSYLKYNSFVPKRNIDIMDINTGAVSTSPSNYYDSRFDTISSDPDLLAFWEVLAHSAEFMNATLNDASTTLSHNSLLKMSKSMTDLLLDKNNGVMNKTVRILSETGQTFKDLLSTKVQKQRASDIMTVNKNGIATIESEVGMRFSTFLLALSNAAGKNVTAGTKFKFEDIPTKVQQVFEQATGESITYLFNKHSDGETIDPKIVKQYFTNQIMEDQTFNLPVMMRAYLDSVSEYKAQKDALPKIGIYKSLYDGIRLTKKDKGIIGAVEDIATRIVRKNRETGIEDARWKGQLRLEHWVNKNVKGVEDKEYWVQFNSIGKNLRQGEKEFKKQAEEYLARVDRQLAGIIGEEQLHQLINDPGTIDLILDKEAKTLAAQRIDIQYKLEDIGMTYTLATMYNTIVNRLSIFVGLGWNIPSQFINRFQGMWQGMVNDTGRYWTAGNFYPANAFINRKGMRMFVPSYRNEVNKTKLLVEKLNIIQDATNELDRARRKSGFTGIVKRINPFYLTEYTEWHNQTPQILAMLMDQRITDNEGNEHQIFDGSSFPAYNIQDGQLVLKPEFRTDDNIATWETFSNNKSADIKDRMSGVIALLNGDYSRTGSVVAKSKVIGKTLMMFKTWLPNQIFLRFARNQTDINLGLENFNGAYTGAFSDKKTRTAAGLGIAGIAGVSALGGLPLALGVIAPTMLIGYLKYGTPIRVDGENSDTIKQLSAMGQSILKKFIGLPVNTLSGKNLIEAHKFDKLDITEKDKQNLTFIATELAGLLWLTLIKVMIKGMLGHDKEDEPKQIVSGTPNPYYPGDLQTQREKEFYNVAENMITRLIDDSALYTNPDALWTTMSHPAGMDSWFKKIEKVSDGLKRRYVDDNDVLQTGPNAGKSKLGLALGETFIPGIVNEWSKGELGYFGFKRYADAEWKPGEVMDKLPAFNSDYKMARSKIKAQRAEEKERLVKYWTKELAIDAVEDPATKQVLEEEMDKIIKAELDVTHPLDMRYNFDENQDAIE